MLYYKIFVPIKQGLEYINLVPIGDIHFGQPYCNETKALEFRDYVLNTPDTYTIDMGDDMDNVIRESVGDIYSQIYSPAHQMEKTKAFWKPVQDADKLWCIMDDNHTARSRRAVDWRMVEDVCKSLGARYGNFGVLLDIYLGEQRYKIYAMHGKKSGTGETAALKYVLDMSNRCVADIYLRGHHHKKVVYQNEIKIPTDMGIKEHKRTYGVTGSFLEWDGSYAEEIELPISVKGCIKLKLFVDKWDVHASL